MIILKLKDKIQKITQDTKKTKQIMDVIFWEVSKLEGYTSKDKKVDTFIKSIAFQSKSLDKK